MAAAGILYRPERSNYLITSDGPWQNPRQTAAQTTPAPSNNLRLTFQDTTSVARGLPTEEALCLEIERLCTATLTIDDAFYDIARRLSDASREQSDHTDLYNTCRTLEARWNEHHTTYRNLIWRSREFAGEAQGTVDDFRELVLPSLRDRERTRSEKQQIIREQIEVLQNTSQPSQDLCQEFLTFGRALDTYIADFSRVVEGLGVGEQITKVDKLENKLRSAKKAMDAVNREVGELGWKFAADVAIAGIALLLAFVVPTLWATVASATAIGIDYASIQSSGLKLLETRRLCNLATTEYDAVKAEYNLERGCLSQMTRLQSALQDSRPLVHDVTAKLGVFACVWAAITADIRKLSNSLRHADDPTSQLFILRVQRLERMYGYLSQALRHYQIQVRLPQ